MTAKDQARQAANIDCGTCDFCAAVHVNLMDENHSIFATASVPAAVGEEFISRFRECLSELGSRCSAPAVKQ
jgi:threonine dehydrogenase-like Zn-dependent dehydrogenase